ncbi:MAG TPA: RsmE family RNA methyltransferase [Candidatus Didemnitutus sp.]|nr:RsmE family RNA methyltransferase [Candidatus Didemnitutus sp.]
MNLILFEPGEESRPLALTDPRAVHLREVLQRQPGESFDAGIVNGSRGRGTVKAVGSESLELAFSWGDPPVPLEPFTLIVGLPRPQTARDILREATTLGVARLVFASAARTEPGYAQSTLWQGGEWRRHLLTGAAQAFDTRIPEVVFGVRLSTALADLPTGGTRIALDNYEATAALPASIEPANSPLVLAIGPERGWADEDRAVLRGAGFALAHLGTRVLRTETAVIAAVTLAKARRGWM